jgi:hypothetical protein
MQIMELIQASGGIGAIAQQVGLSESQARAGTAALLPAILGGLQKQASAGGIEGLSAMLSNAGGATLLENLVSSAPTDTSLGHNLLGQLFGSKDVSRAVAAQAAETTGLNGDTLKKMLPLLAMAVTGVMAKQGDTGLLGQVVGLLGGEQGGSAALGLGKLLDRNGDGNPLDDVLGMAGKLFGR